MSKNAEARSPISSCGNPLGSKLNSPFAIRAADSRKRRSEFVIAALTAVTVCVAGVQQGIVLAIVASVIDLIRRQYRPRDFVVGIGHDGEHEFQAVEPGAQSAPGLIVFRYDADLFFANSGRFVDDVEALVDSAPDPVEWLIVDAAPISDMDYSALLAIGGLLDYLDARGVRLVLARDDEALDGVLSRYGLDARITQEKRFRSLAEAVDAFERRSAPQAPSTD